MSRAIKEFTVEEWTDSNSYYHIEVRDSQGVIVDTFVWPTMADAIRTFENAGYKRA